MPHLKILQKVYWSNGFTINGVLKNLLFKEHTRIIWFYCLRVKKKYLNWKSSGWDSDIKGFSVLFKS